LSNTGVIFNIQRFSIHDGPGIRTTVFFKGCSLRCFWCHNPEGRHARPEIQFFPERCIGCGNCLSNCPNHAHILKKNCHIFIREYCQGCGRCAEGCYANALELIGQYMTADDVVEEILKDRMFYETSNGGVTLSGGEPVLQAEFASEILERCNAEDLHTAIETCGNYPWQNLELLLPVTDLIMMDIKHLEPDKHKKNSGESNERILENAHQLALTNKPIIFRVPVVPGINDTYEEISDIAKFVQKLIETRINNTGRKDEGTEIQLELLPFHILAGDKYRSLGLAYHAKDLESPPKERMQKLTEIVKSLGIEVVEI